LKPNKKEEEKNPGNTRRITSLPKIPIRDGLLPIPKVSTWRVQDSTSLKEGKTKGDWSQEAYPERGMISKDRLTKSEI